MSDGQWWFTVGLYWLLGFVCGLLLANAPEEWRKAIASLKAAYAAWRKP